MAHQQQHKQYLRTQIQTASREQLVLMLFDGALRFCEQGKKALEQGDLEPGHVALTRAQEVVMELLYGVDRDKGGELADNLVRLYGYMLTCLVEANMRRNMSKVDEVKKILNELRDGWLQSMNQMKEAPSPQAPSLQEVPAPQQNPSSAGQQEGTQGSDVVALSKDSEEGAVKEPSPSAPAPAKARPPAPSLGSPLAGGLQPRLSVQG